MARWSCWFDAITAGRNARARKTKTSRKEQDCNGNPSSRVPRLCYANRQNNRPIASLEKPDVIAAKARKTNNPI
jgi:hypothetical protein